MHFHLPAGQDQCKFEGVGQETVWDALQATGERQGRASAEIFKCDAIAQRRNASDVTCRCRSRAYLAKPRAISLTRDRYFQTSIVGAYARKGCRRQGCKCGATGKFHCGVISTSTDLDRPALSLNCSMQGQALTWSMST